MWPITAISDAFFDNGTLRSEGSPFMVLTFFPAYVVLGCGPALLSRSRKCCGKFVCTHPDQSVRSFRMGCRKYLQKFGQFKFPCKPFLNIETHFWMLGLLLTKLTRNPLHWNILVSCLPGTNLIQFELLSREKDVFRTVIVHKGRGEVGGIIFGLRDGLFENVLNQVDLTTEASPPPDALLIFQILTLTSCALGVKFVHLQNYSSRMLRCGNIHLCKTCPSLLKIPCP